MDERDLGIMAANTYLSRKENAKHDRESIMEWRFLAILFAVGAGLLAIQLLRHIN